MNLNSVVLMGRLTKAPDLRYTQSGKPVCSFTIAINGYTDETDYFDCVAWEKTGEYISKKYAKGAMICITGRLKNREWEKDGVRRTKTDIIVGLTYPTGERLNNDKPVKFEELADDDGELPF